MPSESFQLRGSRIWIAGYRGLLGQALVRRLAVENCDLLTTQSAGLDLRIQSDVNSWMAEHRPDAILLAAARAGGILANRDRPAEFLYDNLAIEANVIEAARQHGVRKLVLVGSACVYPNGTPQPLVENSILQGPLEPTLEFYAIAKIAGLKLCQAYRRQYSFDCIAATPCNLYGPGDKFDLQSSHVLAALLRKIHEAKQRNDAAVEIWGTGTPRREFLHVDDCADGLVYLLQHYSSEEHVNLGVGQDVSIRELAELIAQVVGYQGEFRFDATKPDGAPRKLLDVGKLAALGWRAKIGLERGIRETYAWYCAM